MANAKDQVKAILAETRRRKYVWAHMQRAAHEAVAAVTAEARRRGVQGQNWVDGEFTSLSSPCTTVHFLTAQSRLDEAMKARVPRETHSFLLYATGSVMRPVKSGTYEGYPDLTEDDPAYFREAAVAQLMAALSAYLRKHGKPPRHNRKGKG